ncbi:hypothetical protein [Nitrobacter sp.]|uniref:hypothetical protein n=1 Tax=Nitrobacter sp. TaxID=29420 RepID=UPI0029CABF77|nr:hypothetical protein [Nitrobacter sp.]
MKDLVHSIAPVQSLAPAATNASRNGTGVDLQGYEGAIVEVSAGAWTDGSHTPKIQESSDNSTWNDVAAADQIGSFTAVTSSGTASNVQTVSYIGSKRYIRAVITVSGATTGALLGANVLKGHARVKPAGTTLSP